MRALSSEQVARIRDVRYGDGLTLPATARIVGCSELTVWRYAPGAPGRVDNAKLRAAFEASPLTAAEVAKRMGWLDDGVGDSSRVKRALGIYANVSTRRGARRVSVSRRIDAETAGLMAEALGLAAWEVMPDEEVAA